MLVVYVMKITHKLKLFLPPNTHRPIPIPAIHKLTQHIVKVIPMIIISRFMKMRVLRVKRSPVNDMKNTPSNEPPYIIVIIVVKFDF